MPPSSGGGGAGVAAAQCRCAELPRIEVRYSLRHDVTLPPKTAGKPSVLRLGYSLVAGLFNTLRRRTARTKLRVLDDLEGVLRPGVSTVVISAPGSGSTTLLRLISGRTKPGAGDTLLYNSWTRQQVVDSGVNLSRLSSFCSDRDEHEPLLTTEETFGFVARAIAAVRTRFGHHAWLHLPNHHNGRQQQEQTAVATRGTASDEVAGAGAAVASAPGGEPAGDAPAAAVEPDSGVAQCNYCRPPAPDYMINKLGLDEARTTYIGSNMIRGISGGQKRRVTVGESLMMNSRIITLDSATSGLDAATAVQIIQHIVQYTHATHATTIAVLEQPTVEVFNSFDDVLLLSEGKALYHGPVRMLEAYLNALGFVRPSYMDIADFASELVTDPARAADLSLDDRRGRYATECAVATADGSGGGDADADVLPAAAAADADLPAWDGMPLPTLLAIDAMCAHWRQSQSRASLLGGLPEVPVAAGAAAPEAAAGVGSPPGGQPAVALVAVEVPTTKQLQPQPPVAAAVEPNVNAHIAPSGAYASQGVVLQAAEDRQLYGLAMRPSFATQTAMCGERQLRLTFRNKGLLIARWLNVLIMGLVISTLAINADATTFQLRFGLALYICIFIGFSNQAEVPATLQSRPVVYKQTSAGLYQEFPYVWCVVLVSVPVAIVADTIFGSLVYWISNWTPQVDRYLVFLLTLLLVDLTIASLFRFNMFGFSSQEKSSAFGLAIISVWIIGSGFFVIRSLMPVWLAWIPFASPYGWAVTTLGNNEFGSSRYSAPAPGNPSQTIGQSYMALFDFLFGDMAKWGGIIFIAGLWVLLGFLVGPLALRYCRFDYHPGTRRRTAGQAVESTIDLPALAAGVPTTVIPHLEGSQLQGDDATATEVGAAIAAARNDTGANLPPVIAGSDGVAAATVIGSVPSALAAPFPASGSRRSVRRGVEAPVQPALDFQRVMLVYQDIRYTVRTRAGENRVLLQGISGWSVPGRVCCLMGASGAGKTTLMDVLAFRKTAGKVEGTLRLNGQPATADMLSRIAAYCEQEDIHMPTATVREALEFSAKLRIRQRISHERMQFFLDRILKVLELDTLKDRLVGSLSRNEAKRLTIGVELASAPSLLFVDEPTTGLDSRSAAVIMRVLRRVASTGRAVICTIHQPSAAIFFSFDDLMLLAPGGYQIYFGPLGRHARSLVKYLERLSPLVPRLPLGKNPATWMLEISASELTSGGMEAISAASAAAPAEEVAAGVVPAASPPVTVTTSVPGEQHLPQQAGVVGSSSDHAPAAAAAMTAPAAPTETFEDVFNPVELQRRYWSSRVGVRVRRCVRALLGQPPEDVPSAVQPESLVSIAPEASDLAVSEGRVAPAPPQPPGGGDAVVVTVPPLQTPNNLLRAVSAGSERSGLASVTSSGKTSTESSGTGAGAFGEGLERQLLDQQATLTPVAAGKATASNFLFQFWHVYARANKDYWRNAEFVAVRLFIALFLAVLFALLFLGIDFNSFAGTQSALGFMLGGITFTAAIFFSTSITVQFERREVYYRERAARYYAPEAYCFSAFLVEIPYVAGVTFLFIAISYWVAGLQTIKGGFGPFLFYFAGAVILSAFFMATAVAYAAIFPALPVAQIVGGLTISINFLFAGLFIPRPAIPAFWQGLYYAVPTSHVMRALATNQFFCEGAGCQTITVPTPTGVQTLTQYEYVSQYVQSSYGDRWREFGWAILAVAVMIVIAVGSYRFINHQNR